MEGNGDDVAIINELYGLAIVSGSPPRKKQEHPYSGKTSNVVKRSHAETNTGIGGGYIKHNVQINLTTVKPTLHECGYINAMSKDTRYFAQTLRKYPLPNSVTKSSDLIREKLRRAEKPISAYRKTTGKKRNARKTASHQAIQSNVVFKCKIQDTQRLSKVEEILLTSPKLENNSDNEVIDYGYNYMKSKLKLSNVDVRYCTSTNRACTCRRMKNVVCTRAEDCPNVRHRLDHQRKFYQEAGKKPSCHCNVCQASREATSTSRLSPSEYANHQDQDEEVQIQSRNYLESYYELEKEIGQWTEAKLNNDDVVHTKLIQKLAKALEGLSKDKEFLPEARHEVVKYLTALSIIDSSIKDQLDRYADDLLNNLSKSLRYTKSVNNIDGSNKNNIEKSLNPSNESKTKIFIRHFLNQLPIENNIKVNDQLDTLAEKFLNILQEHNIKLDLREATSHRDRGIPGEYEEKDNYLIRILSWYNSMPELEQKLPVQIYDNIICFQDLASKLSALNKNINLKENLEKAKGEIMQWLKSYLTLHNIPFTESLIENLNDKLVAKLVAPIEEKIYYKGLLQKEWITKEIYSLLKDMNHEILQNNDILGIVHSLVIHLSFIKEKNDGNLTLHQCDNELKSWFEYLEQKYSKVKFKENEKIELKCNILSRIKILIKHEMHKKSYQLKRLKLLTNNVLEKISTSVTDNNINISQEKLLNLISDLISQVFETFINENLISKNIYEKVYTILHSILNLSTDAIKGLVKSMLDKMTSTWNNSAENYFKKNNQTENNGLQTNYSSRKSYKSQFVTSTPRHTEEEFLLNFDGDSTDFSNLINDNFLHKVIKDWIEENRLNLNEIEKENIIKSITSDIICRYNYAKAFSKTISDLEEIEYLKYCIFKVLGDYMKDQEINKVISEVNKLHDTINKTFISPIIVEDLEVNNEDQVSLEVLKSNLVNAFINLNSYLVEDRFKKEYKGKLKLEISNFCSQYFQRFPATPLGTEQLHDNIYNALETVPKPISTKSEIDFVTQVKNWLDELCKENNLPNIDNENIVLDLANPLLQKKKRKSILYNNGDELSKTISEWVQNYSTKQKILINDQYWTGKLVEKLKALDTFQEMNLSKETSAHMYTIPAAESFGAQVNKSIIQSEENNEILAKDLLSNEDRELLLGIKERFSASENIVKLKTDIVDDKPEHELVPNVCVREYHWESIDKTKTIQNTLPPSETDGLNKEYLQPKGLDHKAQLTLADKSPPKGKSDKFSSVGVGEYHWQSMDQIQTFQNPLPPDEIDELDPGYLQPQSLNRKSQTTLADNSPKRKSDKLADASVREYNWKSIDRALSFHNSLPPDEMDELDPGYIQPQSFNRKSQTTFVDNIPKRKSDERNLVESMIPQKLKKLKCKNKKFSKRSLDRRIEPSKVVCPNKFTVKSKHIDKDMPCSCSDCLINKRRIKYFCKKNDNDDLENCPECFSGYCPFPSCAYFE